MDSPPRTVSELLRDRLGSILRATLAAADPCGAVRRSIHRDGGLLRVGGWEIDLPDVDSVLVVGAGKAAAGMARGAMEVLAGRTSHAEVTTVEGKGDAPPGVTLRHAAHPAPDERSAAAAHAALAIAAGAGEGDLVLCLLSGGGSALWGCPPEGVSLAELREVSGALMRAGADISQLNTVRRHLSRIAGGRLAQAAHPARLVTLAISDVVGDAPADIASGPTVPDPTTFADALGVLDRYGVEAPPVVRRHLERGARGDVRETPKPGDPAFSRASYQMVARNRDALQAAAVEAERLGYPAVIVTDRLQGKAREMGRRIAGMLQSCRATAALVLGGETTVTVRGDGRGGRSQELALAAALALEGTEGIALAAIGTDGIDGPTDAAGAMVDGGTAGRARAAGIDPAEALSRNDAYAALRAAGDLIVTGPTGTNVNDVVVGLVGDPSG